MVLVHKEGSFDYIEELIEYRKKQIAEWRAETYNHRRSRYDSKKPQL
ncbi:hypothetical protein KPP_12251 [Klebsiella phage KPP-1]|nr:hypothetical protein KPP_12251 [Klebsiella phage KPP-1]